MCGIFAIQTDTNAAEKTLRALKTLEYRGYDSWGIASLQDTGHRLQVEKRIGKIGTATLNSPFSIDNCSIAIGHTRWATHGTVTEANAHPHLDCTGRFAIVHNGIVENYALLKKELLRQGHLFQSETDSEVIAHLIEKETRDKRLENKEERQESRDGRQEIRESVRAAFLQLRGLNAIVVLDRKTETIVACNSGSPLVVCSPTPTQKIDRHGTPLFSPLAKGGNKGGCLASDAIALVPYTDQVHYMEDGEMVVMDGSGLSIFDIDTGKEKDFSWKKIEVQNTAVSLGNFPHFMLKEIHEQQKIVHRLQTIDYRLTQRAKRIFFVGCGSAYYAGLYGQYLCMDHKIDARAVIGSEFGRMIPLLTPDDAVVFLSQSGETIDLVEHAKVLKQKKVPLLGIINREGSTLTRLCDRVFPLCAGPEQCVLATKSWTAMLAILTALFGKEHNRQIEIDPLLSGLYRKDIIHPIALRLSKATHIFLIGRGRQYPLALESALKIKEVTYIHAEAQAGGELKHGSIALIEPGVPLIVFALSDETYPEIISNAMEVKARGARIIGISDRPHPCFDQTIIIDVKLGNPYIASIVTMQLLAYEMAVLLGRDPDKPRNLAKSVTVK